jgi:penicillin-binding protein 1C
MRPSFPPIPTRWQALLRRRIFVIPLLIVLVLLVLRFFPREPLLADQPFSRAVYSADGALLRLTLATDEQYRLWQPLEKIPAPLQNAVLLYEDRWFYRHPGVNPVALFRAAADSASGQRRRGASTITMQLARRLYGIDSRTPPGKLQQMLAALWIELRYGKREILEAYLNVAPYGGNVEGAGAASEVFFRKPLSQITLPEAIALAVIPQNPQRRRVDRQADDVLLAARARLWQRWLAQHPQDAHLAADQALRLQASRRESLPFEAPHLVDYLLRTTPSAPAAETPTPIYSTLDLRLQKLCERVLRDYLRTRAESGIRNASALLLDSESMEVKAVVGSADYFAADIQGQVNGTLAKRSPGSTLKPFIYALALDQGHLHPRTMLKDAPTAFGPFSPENYDGHFVGPISAQDALIRSRNIPAVSVAAKLSRPDLYDFLRLGGVGRLATREHYGLALVLGGGEVTMEELAQLYALLPNGGLVKPLRYLKGTEEKGEALPPRLLSDEAAFITLEMLQHNVRPDTLAPARPAIAWKTGTSWGFRDAWTAGVFDRYVLVVWLGNFAGEGNPALIGIDTAAPLFLRLADAIRLERTGSSARPRLPPANLRQVEVCATSGDLADGLCRAKVNTWFIPGKSPIRGQRLHRRVHVDRQTGKAQCTPGPDTREEIHEYWSTDLQRVFRDAGLPRRAPPTLDCGATEATDAPRIASPLRGETYTVRQSKPSPLMLRAEAGAGARKLYWWLDSTLIGATRPGETLFWQAPTPGTFTLRVVDESGRADERQLRIEFLP